MSLDPERDPWDENRWAWDSEADSEELRSARRRLLTVLHHRATGTDDRAADPTQVPPTANDGPFWRRWWRWWQRLGDGS